MSRLLVAAALLSSAYLSAEPPLQWVSGKVLRVERVGSDYYYSIYGGGCGLVVRTAKKLAVQPEADVKFSPKGGFVLILDGTSKVQRAKFWDTWAPPPPPAPPPGVSDDVHRQVAVLVEEMLDGETEQTAFADIEALGCAAVPAMLRHLDDWRNLPGRTLAVRNQPPDASDVTQFYTPAKVVDALAVILNQHTGRSFGFIYNGATPDDREKAVKAWRDFLMNTPTSRLCGGHD
jgi:hypothetical protein